jgi:hypothetical protein
VSTDVRKAQALRIWAAFATALLLTTTLVRALDVNVAGILAWQGVKPESANEARLWQSTLTLIVLATAVAVIGWLYQARRNAEAFSGRRTWLGPAWAIAGWFVPIANFVLPGIVASDAARLSGVRTWLVWSWWAAYVGGVVSTVLIDASGTTAGFATLASLLLIVAACALAITVIWSVTAAQGRRLRH